MKDVVSGKGYRLQIAAAAITEHCGEETLLAAANVTAVSH